MSPLRHDTGLARERSDLSWGRTLLAMLTVTALFLRWLPSHGLAALGPFALAAVCAAGLAVLRSRRRAEVLGGGGSAAEEVFGLAALVIVIGVAGLALILLGL